MPTSSSIRGKASAADIEALIEAIRGDVQTRDRESFWSPKSKSSGMPAAAGLVSEGAMIEAEQWQGKRIAVLMGGLSAEREVSLRTGNAVLRALQGRGLDAVAIDAGRDLPARLADAAARDRLHRPARPFR